MENWQQTVREYLAEYELPRAIREAVVAELASHLEEIYDEARETGLTNEAAIELALREVGNWRALAKDICRAQSKEDLMNSRTKSLWLPAMVNLMGAASLLTIVQKLGVEPRVVWMKDRP